MERINLTPFAAEHTVMMDGAGFERLLVVVKATYSIAAGTAVLAGAQEPVYRADDYRDTPQRSSLRRAGEMPMEKPGTEIVIAGSAYPSQPGAAEALVGLTLGPLHKSVRVVGERAWVGEVAPSISRPVPFERMPLLWERAYGGRDETGDAEEMFAENPVGRGFRSSTSRRPVDGALLPNLEHPAEPIHSPDDRPRPAGFGPIAPWWSPRPRYAGTYDERWKRERMPLLPDDFNSLFHHAAPHDQILPGPLLGGETLSVTGVRPGGGAYEFALPHADLEVVVRVGRDRLVPPVRVDTMILDADTQTLSLVWRASVSVHMRLHRLEWIKIQERARA
jgi:hypothetical protein